MALFEKKECGVCGEKVGLLGAKKVEDGVICSDCAKKLSPFFNERKRSTVEDIRQQIAYREQNRQNLAQFNPTRTLGNSNTKVIVDDNQRKFVVSKRSDFRAENADIIDIAQVNNVRYEVKEHKDERFTHDADGNRRSYNPPQYDYKYEIDIYILVNHPYFSEIEFELTTTRPESRYTEEFHRCEQTANEIVAALGGMPGMAGGMGYQQMGGYQQQPPMGGYQQQPPMGGYQQQPMGGYQQQPPMGGYQQQPMGGYQQQPMGGYQQQPPMGGYQQQPMGGYQQQPPMGGYQQQPPTGGYQQPPAGGYQQQQPQQAAVAAAAAGGAWFCQNCGAQNTTNFCQSCGSPRP